MKIFSHCRAEGATGCAVAGAAFARSIGMTIIPRDSDIVAAAALLAIVLVTGLIRVFGL
jgi:hypothetical protein